MVHGCWHDPGVLRTLISRCHAQDSESNMQRHEGDAFPTAFQAVLLYVALLLCELFVGAALRDVRGIVRLAPDQASALTLVLANGCVFVVVMHFQNITYRSLFHHSSASRFHVKHPASPGVRVCGASPGAPARFHVKPDGLCASESTSASGLVGLRVRPCGRQPRSTTAAGSSW